MPYRFELHFLGGDVKKGQMPGAVAQIRINKWTEDDAGHQFVSNECMGITELEGQVKKLKAELDEILSQGRRKFKDYRARTDKAIKEKQRARGT